MICLVDSSLRNDNTSSGTTEPIDNTLDDHTSNRNIAYDPHTSVIKFRARLNENFKRNYTNYQSIAEIQSNEMEIRNSLEDPSCQNPLPRAAMYIFCDEFNASVEFVTSSYNSYSIEAGTTIYESPLSSTNPSLAIKILPSLTKYGTGGTYLPLRIAPQLVQTVSKALTSYSPSFIGIPIGTPQHPAAIHSLSVSGLLSSNSSQPSSSIGRTYLLTSCQRLIGVNQIQSAIIRPGNILKLNDGGSVMLLAIYMRLPDVLPNNQNKPEKEKDGPTIMKVVVSTIERKWWGMDSHNPATSTTIAQNHAVENNTSPSCSDAASIYASSMIQLLNIDSINGLDDQHSTPPTGLWEYLLSSKNHINQLIGILHGNDNANASGNGNGNDNGHGNINGSSWEFADKNIFTISPFTATPITSSIRTLTSTNGNNLGSAAAAISSSLGIPLSIQIQNRTRKRSYNPSVTNTIAQTSYHTPTRSTRSANKSAVAARSATTTIKSRSQSASITSTSNVKPTSSPAKTRRTTTAAAVTTVKQQQRKSNPTATVTSTSNSKRKTSSGRSISKRIKIEEISNDDDNDDEDENNNNNADDN